MVKNHFNSHAWLTVFESIKVEDLLKDMIQQLFSEIMQPVPFGVEIMSINRLKCLGKDFLQQRRYVVVFDDVWNVNAWEAIKYVLPDNNSGSCVILTICFAHISSTYCEETKGNVYNLMLLSPKESWTLFCNKTFRGNLCPSHLKKISLRILKRYEGLPLAIVAISGVLATKDWSRIEECEMLYRSFGAEFKGNEKLERMKKELSLNYNAEGFVNATDGKTIEEVVEGYLNELFNRSLVQVAQRGFNGKPYSFHIHNLMREIILSKAIEENIIQGLKVARESSLPIDRKHIGKYRI
ncbi:disease resistance protein RPM1-like [Camellia sinensis]|uniref:disease resistance protein RPM1-like n=1 Tax=Camellia sinensis TaxID=4442 RepID=UPI0010366170|nr:disease resistance protein RPM1-like [Camellia sinensis]